MKDVWKRYRHWDHEYLIEYHSRPDGTIGMFCTKRPESTFANAPYHTHLNPDNSICVTAGRQPRDFEKAEAIAFLWMQGYSEYIRTGKSVPSGGRVNIS